MYTKLPNGINTCIDDSFAVLTLRLPFILFAPPGKGGAQTKRKARGGLPFICLRLLRRERDTVQIVVFFGGPLLEIIVPLGNANVKEKMEFAFFGSLKHNGTRPNHGQK